MQTRDHIKRGRLAAARRAKQTDQFAIRDDKRHVVHCCHLRAFLAGEDFLQTFNSYFHSFNLRNVLRRENTFNVSYHALTRLYKESESVFETKYNEKTRKPMNLNLFVSFSMVWPYNNSPQIGEKRINWAFLGC